jgi:hypothetical protein
MNGVRQTIRLLSDDKAGVNPKMPIERMESAIQAAFDFCPSRETQT